MTNDGTTIEFDRDMLGAEGPVRHIDVTVEAIRRYCELVGDTNPLYLDEAVARGGPHGGIIAPPALLLRVRTEPIPDPKLRIDGVAVDPDDIEFYAGERLELLELVRPGDRLRATGRLTDVYEKTGRSGLMVFVVRCIDFVNQHERPVATLEYSVVQRGPDSEWSRRSSS